MEEEDQDKEVKLVLKTVKTEVPLGHMRYQEMQFVNKAESKGRWYSKTVFQENRNSQLCQMLKITHWI